MKNLGKANPYYPGRVQSDSIAVFVLLANTEQHMSSPANATIMTLSCTGSFYCLTNGQTAAVPGATDTSLAVTTPELSPTVLAVVAGTVLSFVAPANCVLTVSFYRDTDLS